MPAPTTQQMMIAIAALTRGYTLPSVTGNQTGIAPGPGNTLQIPINADSPQGVDNVLRGDALQISADANYIYVTNNVGDVAGGD